MDDLLDLSWSDTPPPGSKPPSASPLLQPQPQAARSSAFDLLSKPGNSNGPNYSSSSYGFSRTGTATPGGRTGTPLLPRSATASGTVSPAPRASVSVSASVSPAPRAAASPAGGDAFSALLGGGAAPASASRNMTMAERSAQLAAEKAKKAQAESSRWDHGEFWDKQLGGGGGNKAAGAGAAKPGRDILAPTASAPGKAPALAVPLGRNLGPSPSLSPAPASAQPKAAGSFWDMQQPERSTSASPAQAKSSSTSLSSLSKATSTGTGAAAGGSGGDAFDDLDGFLSAPATQAKPATKAAAAAADPWDLDALAATVDVEYASEDDDLLGDLGRPPKPKTKAPSPSHASPHPRPGPSSNTSSSSPARTASPPPHVVGQIVEMGFSPAQARAALAATPSGLDVQAALDALLGSTDGNGRADELEMDDERIAREMQAREDREGARRESQISDSDRREQERRARHAARRAGPARDGVRERERDRDREDEGDFGVQADQLMAQASEIGASMFSKATSLWNTGKERALKVYEEQRKALDAQNAASKKRPADGQPRWMVEAEEEAEAAASGAAPPRTRTPTGRNGNGNGAGAGAGSGFRDDFGGMPDSPPMPQAGARAAAPPSSADTARRVESLFDDAPRPYVSKNRHPKGRGTPQAASPVPAATPRRPATPLVTRQLVPATAAQTSAAAQHKAKGNDHFKLGRYAEADAAYTSAIGALPAGHLHLVTLHNNRAATRLKLGESGTCIQDASAVIEIVGPSYHPSKEAPLPDAHADVRLGDALVKATVKRAQAYEMGEKWKLALADWERVLGFDAAMSANAAATKSQASEGVRRAKRVLEGGDKPAPTAGTPAPKPKPRASPAPRPAAPVDISRSAAVSDMRAAAAAAAAEDDERAALKDAVDARIAAWKTGKETNLRALIASLDTVLWDDIMAGVKVGMHELIAEKQVKIKYMKVVARLHPDKLQAGRTSVEQRMLASGAFGVLSEAWAAFNA